MMISRTLQPRLAFIITIPLHFSSIFRISVQTSKHMKSRFLLLLLLPILFSCGKNSKNNKSRNDKMPPAVVETMVVTTQKTDHNMSFTGTILANEEAEIRTEAPGRIVLIGFEEGSQVEKGRLLLKINDAELQAQLLKNKVQLELATTEVNRKKELLSLRGISQEEYDISQNKFNTLEAEKQLILAQISKTEIRAPFSGTIGLRMVSAGTYITAATLITTLQQTDPVKIDFRIPEKYGAFAGKGKPISFTTEGNKYIYKAVVYATESRIDPETRTIQVRARCSNPGNRIIPGAFARIVLNMFPGQESILIPTSAVMPVLNGEQVYIVKGGVAQICRIETGVRSDSAVEVIKGLNTGDSLILTGLLQIKPDQKIKPAASKKQNQ